jgi:ribosomal protein S18 acetylase RimI-like enzyme
MFVRNIQVERASAASAELVEALAQLVPQLSRTAAAPADEELAELLGQPATTLLLARDGEAIVGVLTLVVVRIPTGVKARIEDVVVDESARGKGVGEALTREALRLAAAARAVHVELSSHPSREAANRLYRRLGFAERETNVYRLTF